MKEVWKIIEEAPDYAVSNFGRIKRITTKSNAKAGHIKTARIGAHGYDQVSLSTDGKTITRSIHRLVCRAFHGRPPTPKHEAAHRDGNRRSNLSDNLRWLTPKENAADKKRHGTYPDQRGELSHKAILTAAEVQIIRSTKRYNGVLKDLAKRFGVTENHVMGLRTRGSRKWAGVHAHPPAINAC